MKLYIIYILRIPIWKRNYNTWLAVSLPDAKIIEGWLVLFHCDCALPVDLWMWYMYRESNFSWFIIYKVRDSNWVWPHNFIRLFIIVISFNLVIYDCRIISNSNRFRHFIQSLKLISSIQPRPIDCAYYIVLYVTYVRSSIESTNLCI